MLTEELGRGDYPQDSVHISLSFPLVFVPKLGLACLLPQTPVGQKR